MDERISQDLGRGVKVGLAVYDGVGSRVGYVDETDKTHGWMVVRSGGLQQKKLWIPYRLVKSVDERELVVSIPTNAIEVEFSKPPARSTTLAQRDGTTIAITTEPSGFDQQQVVTSEVELDHIKKRLAIGQQVWTADDVLVGAIKDFDRDGRYIVVETGHLTVKHALLVPLALVMDVDREAAEATLAVSNGDLDAMKRHQAGDSVIELQAPLDYWNVEAGTE